MLMARNHLDTQYIVYLILAILNRKQQFMGIVHILDDLLLHQGVTSFWLVVTVTCKEAGIL